MEGDFEMITAALIDPMKQKIKSVSIKNSIENDESLFDDLIQTVDGFETGADEVRISGINVTVWHAYGSPDGSECFWRFKNTESYYIFFSNSLILGERDRSEPYITIYNQSCPKTCEELVSEIEWGMLYPDSGKVMWIKDATLADIEN